MKNTNIITNQVMDFEMAVNVIDLMVAAGRKQELIDTEFGRICFEVRNDINATTLSHFSMFADVVSTTKFWDSCRSKKCDYYIGIINTKDKTLRKTAIVRGLCYCLINYLTDNNANESDTDLLTAAYIESMRDYNFTYTLAKKIIEHKYGVLNVFGKRNERYMLIDTLQKNINTECHKAERENHKTIENVISAVTEGIGIFSNKYNHDFWTTVMTRSVKIIYPYTTKFYAINDDFKIEETMTVIKYIKHCLVVIKEEEDKRA